MPEIDIRHIAKLARLHVEEQEIQSFEKEMEDIVGMVEHLPDFENSSLPLKKSDEMKLRRDEIGNSMERGEILKNAPAVEAGCIVVPKIVE